MLLSASIFHIFTRNVVIKFISISYEAEHRIFLIVQLYRNRDIICSVENPLYILDARILTFITSQKTGIFREIHFAREIKK